LSGYITLCYEPKQFIKQNYFVQICIRFYNCAVSLEYYFKQLKELKISIEELIKFGYIRHWYEFEALCLEFIITYKELDFSNYILNQPKTRVGDQKGSDSDAEMIKNYEGEVKFVYSHCMNPYVALYFFINKSFKFIEEYQKIVLKIKADL